MDILKKIQNQPEGVRKIILWTVIILLGLLFLITWIQGLKQRVEQSKEEGGVWKGLNLPEFENPPTIEMPEFPELTEEELKALEEEFQVLEEETKNESE